MSSGVDSVGRSTRSAAAVFSASLQLGTVDSNLNSAKLFSR